MGSIAGAYLEVYRAMGLSAATVGYTESRLEGCGRWLKKRRPRVAREEIDAASITAYLEVSGGFRAKATADQPLTQSSVAFCNKNGTQPSPATCARPASYPVCPSAGLRSVVLTTESRNQPAAGSAPPAADKGPTDRATAGGANTGVSSRK